MRRALGLRLCLCVLAWTLAGGAVAERRVALVIGNGAYRNAPELTHPLNDATDMAAALKSVGFEVILGTDLTKRDLDDKIHTFAYALDKADVALSFYAGHGVQVKGHNRPHGSSDGFPDRGSSRDTDPLTLARSGAQ